MNEYWICSYWYEFIFIIGNICEFEWRENDNDSEYGSCVCLIRKESIINWCRYV